MAWWVPDYKAWDHPIYPIGSYWHISYGMTMHDKLPFSLKSYAFKGQNLPGKGRNWANANFQLWKFKFSSTRTQHTHTRQEWIIIWSGRNWILKHANQPRSDANEPIVNDQNSRLRQQCSKLYNIVVGVLSLAPCYVRKKQVRAVDQTAYPLQTSVASLATDWWMEPWPPALNFNLELERERTKEEKEREEVLHLFRCYTHIHIYLFICTYIL